MLNSSKYWLALSKIPKIGLATIKKLYDHFGSAEAVWKAEIGDISRVEGITRSQVESISRAKSEIDPENELKFVKRFDFMTLDDPDYPEKLKNIYDPPPVLYYRGDLKALNKKAIAIVGTRKPSTYGLSVAKKLAGELSDLGFVIISGMAYGIDSASHSGALEAGGETIAVFGCGINLIYPPENIGLAESISKSGCLLSEFPPDSGTSNWTFPQRNRIISGLSLGVVVVEGGYDSGSLITAKLALEQGREVFAIPGQIENQKVRGPHWLIKQGAKLVEGIEDILEELNMVLPEGYAAKEKRPEKDFSSLSEQERKICEILKNESLHIDMISEKAEFLPQEISGILMILEVKGFVKQLPGKMFFLK